MIRSGIKQGAGAGRANLRKKQTENKWIRRGLKQGAGRANLRKKETMNGLEAAKNRGQGGPTKEKRENEWISRD